MDFPPRASKHSWRSFATAALALMLVLGAAPVASAVSLTEESELGAETLDPISEEEQEPALTPELVLAPRSPLFEDSAAEYAVSVLIRNPSETPIPAGTLTLELNQQRTETLAEFGAEFPDFGAVVVESKVGETRSEDEQTVTLTVRRADFPLTAASEPGVYQLRATLTPKDEPDSPAESAAPEGVEAEDLTPDVITASTSVVWQGTGGAKVSVSMIVPLVLPSDIRTLPTRNQLRTAVPGLNRLLVAATTQRATLAIDPRIIAGIRAYGENAPEEAKRFLSRLESSSLPSFLLQFADADPAAQAALGFTKLLEPTNLDFVSRFGKFPAAETKPETTAPEGEGTADPETQNPEPADPELPDPEPTDPENETSADGGADAEDPAGANETPATPSKLPSLRDLLSWPKGTPTAWPAEGAVDAATLSLLSASNIQTVVLDSENVSQESTPRTTIGNTSALITDAALDAATRAILTADTETERSAALAAAAARLALAAQTASPGIIIGFDRGAVAGAKDPEQLLQTIAMMGWVTPTSHTELATGPAVLKSADTLEDRRELLRTAVSRESSVDEVGAILVHPEYLSGYQRTRLLELFATRYAAPDADFAEVAAAFRLRDVELMQGVQAISTQNTQLVGVSTRVPVQLRNSLPFDALVSVQVVPASAALTVSEPQFSEVAVRAEGNERLLVPVQSRVSSGESGLVVSISSPDGEVTVFTGTLAISISSVVEAIALWTLGGLAALLLGFGIWRSVRRRRRGAPDPA